MSEIKKIKEYIEKSIKELIKKKYLEGNIHQIEIKNWNKLIKIKDLYKFKSMNSTIEYLISKFDIPEKMKPEKLIEVTR